MKLTIDSICLLSSIADKIGIDEKFAEELFSIGKVKEDSTKEEIEKLKEKIGLKLMLKLGTKMHLVKNELIEFICINKNITKEEAKKIDAIEIIKEMLSDKDITDFLKQKAISE